MSRYRPPRAKSSPSITAAGAARLQQELTYLWKEKRPAVTAKVAEAAALGDRSENAEYIYGKRQLREIDARINFLSRRLDDLSVIDQTPADQSRVFFGAWVTLEDEDANTHTYRIVGADEFDQQPDYISVDAPLARALIGKQVDDEISVSVPPEAKPRVLNSSAELTDHHYCIKKVCYRDGNEA